MTAKNGTQSSGTSRFQMVDHVTPLPARSRDGHKGDYGRVLIAAGSRGMAGAAGLCGKAALRSGAGLVTVACPDSIVDVVAGFEPSLMTLPRPSDEVGRLAEDDPNELLQRRSDVVAFGPGLGRSDSLRRFIKRLTIQCDSPLVVDADGLNLLVDSLNELKERSAPTVLTPHVGEFARLTGKPIETIQANRLDLAVAFAAEHNVVLLLKGPGTIVTDGRRAFVNNTGNPGMATGGVGDVLTGVIAAILGQGMTPFDAAVLAAHVHGLAGDFAANDLGEVSMIASDLLEHLPNALASLEAPSPE